MNDARESSHSHSTKPHLDTPGMAVAKAYGFVAYENTAEYKMKKWYEAEKAQKTNTKESPKNDDGGECSRTVPHPVSKEAVDSDYQENLFGEHNQQQVWSSTLRSSLESQLDNIPEASGDVGNKTVKQL